MAQQSPSTSNLDLVIRWLDSKIDKEKEAAISIFCRVGQPAVEPLIQAAIKPGMRSLHLIAILEVIQAIGGSFELDEIFALQSLLRHRSPDVREKTEEVIMAASPCGMPDDPEGLALMRIVNPFLRTPPRPRGRSQSSDILAAMRGDPAAIQRRAKSNAARRRKEEREQGR